MAGNMARLTRSAGRLPEAERVVVAAWDGEVTFRVRGKVFVFADPAGLRLTVKLSLAEAEAVAATEPWVRPAGYGLGRHGWVQLEPGRAPDKERWAQIEEWVLTSYTLVAPRSLAARLRWAGSGCALGS